MAFGKQCAAKFIYSQCEAGCASLCELFHAADPLPQPAGRRLREIGKDPGRTKPILRSLWTRQAHSDGTLRSASRLKSMRSCMAPAFHVLLTAQRA